MTTTWKIRNQAKKKRLKGLFWGDLYGLSGQSTYILSNHTHNKHLLECFISSRAKMPVEMNASCHDVIMWGKKDDTRVGANNHSIVVVLKRAGLS